MSDTVEDGAAPRLDADGDLVRQLWRRGNVLSAGDGADRCDDLRQSGLHVEVRECFAYLGVSLRVDLVQPVDERPVGRRVTFVEA